MTSEFPNASRPANRIKRWSIRLVAVVLISLIAVELFSRFYLGLGDPPLMVADPQIEYMYQPNQLCHRFGNVVRYNTYSMRSDNFPPHKSTAKEFRIMMIGDSVINGGSQTDQSQLASTMLQHELAARLHRPVVVGNISAGSWGPPNELAYVKRFGLFDADIVVIVVSSHDVVDVPTFEPSVGVRLDSPDRRPMTATGELLMRYVWPRLHVMAASQFGDLPPPPDATLNPADVKTCTEALREMIRVAKASGSRVIVAEHWELPEIAAQPKPGNQLLHDAADAEHVEVIQLGPTFARAIAHGDNPFRDVIHPNPRGQRAIVEALIPALVR